MASRAIYHAAAYREGRCVSRWGVCGTIKGAERLIDEEKADLRRMARQGSRYASLFPCTYGVEECSNPGECLTCEDETKGIWHEDSQSDSKACV